MKRILGIFTILLISMSAKAGFLVEPFLSYENGTNSASDTSTPAVDESSKFSGALGYGARLGYRVPNGFSFGLEVEMGSGKFQDNSGSATPTEDQNFTRSVTGIFLGYDRGMFRGYFGYGANDVVTEDPLSTNTAQGKSKITGTNYKIGIGVMPIRHLSINLEYVVPTYKTVTNDSISAAGASTDISSYYSKFNTSIMALSISAPFDFGGK